MNSSKRWPHAIIISVALNIFFLCGVGILSAGVFTTEPVESLLELELVSEESYQESSDNSAAPANVNTKTAIKSSDNGATAPNQNVVSSTVAVQKVTSLSVDEVSTDFASDQGMGEAQEQSSSASGSGAGSSTVSGGGGQSSTGNGSGGIIGPKILSRVYPVYPQSAQEAGITGNVILKVQILENGRAGDISVKQSSGNRLFDEAAITAVYQWRFTPAKERNTGRFVNGWITVSMVFQLN